MNSEFKSYTNEYRKLVLIIISTAFISYLAVFYSNISPPIHNKKAVFFVSIIVESSAIITVYLSGLTKNRFNVFFLITFLILYFSVHSIMTFSIPTLINNERDVKGFVCLEKANKIYGGNCYSSSAIEEASFDPNKLWYEWSIAITKIVLITLWISFIWFLAKLIANFTLFLRIKVEK